MCSLQIVTEQETCLTKHNGGTGPLLTLLGEHQLACRGVNSHPEKKNVKEGVAETTGENKVS